MKIKLTSTSGNLDEYKLLISDYLISECEIEISTLKELLHIGKQIQLTYGHKLILDFKKDLRIEIYDDWRE